MSSKRIATVVFVLVIAAIAIATSGFASPRARSASDDFALRHPSVTSLGSTYSAAFYIGSDYAQRHPEMSGAEVDLSDYALRHPALLTFGPDASDYALRHPELSALVDTSDYALRHPGPSIH